MKMSIARALKEKNRLVGRINQVRSLLSSENVKIFTVSVGEGERPDYDAMRKECEAKRRVDVAALEMEWKALKERLAELKIAIQKANAGAIDVLVRLQEAKSHLAEIDQIQYGENDVSDMGCGRYRVCSAVFGQEYQLSEKKKYGDLVNELQDRIDEYNASTQVEIAD